MNIMSNPREIFYVTTWKTQGPIPDDFHSLKQKWAEACQMTKEGGYEFIIINENNPLFVNNKFNFIFYYILLWGGNWKVKEFERYTIFQKFAATMKQMDLQSILNTFSQFFFECKDRFTFEDYRHYMSMNLQIGFDTGHYLKDWIDKNLEIYRKPFSRGSYSKTFIVQNKIKPTTTTHTHLTTSSSLVQVLKKMTFGLLFPTNNQDICWPKKYKYFQNEQHKHIQIKNIFPTKVPMLYHVLFMRPSGSNKCEGALVLEHYDEQNFFQSTTLLSLFQKEKFQYFHFYYELVCMIYLLHIHNFIHGDLHFENFFFCPNDSSLWLTLKYKKVFDKKDTKVEYKKDEKSLIVYNLEIEQEKKIANKIRLIDFGASSERETRGGGEFNGYNCFSSFLSYSESVLLQSSRFVPFSNLLIEHHWQANDHIKNVDIWALGSIFFISMLSFDKTIFDENFKLNDTPYGFYQYIIQKINEIHHKKEIDILGEATKDYIQFCGHFQQIVRSVHQIQTNIGGKDEKKAKEKRKKITEEELEKQYTDDYLGRLFATSITIMFINDLRKRNENSEQDLETLIKRWAYPLQFDKRKNNFIYYNKKWIKLSVFGIFLSDQIDLYKNIIRILYPLITDDLRPKIIHSYYLSSTQNSEYRKAFLIYMSLCFSWSDEDPKNINWLLTSPLICNSYFSPQFQ